MIEYDLQITDHDREMINKWVTRFDQDNFIGQRMVERAVETFEQSEPREGLYTFLAAISVVDAQLEDKGEKLKRPEDAEDVVRTASNWLASIRREDNKHYVITGVKAIDMKLDQLVGLVVKPLEILDDTLMLKEERVESWPEYFNREIKRASAEYQRISKNIQ